MEIFYAKNENMQFQTIDLWHQALQSERVRAKNVYFPLKYV